MEEMSYEFLFTFFFTAAHFLTSISHFLTTATKFSFSYTNKKCLLCFSSLALAFCRSFSRWASLACRLLSLFLCLSLDFSFSIFQICGRRRRREWKRHESELAFFQSSSRLLQVTDFVKFRWTLLKLNKSHIQVQKERGNFVVTCVLPL